MRTLSVLLLLCLAGCTDSPQSYGITGPGSSAAPPAMPDDATISAPGMPDPGTMYGPSVAPNTGASRYWGYN
jgi:hypothetical protein